MRYVSRRKHYELRENLPKFPVPGSFQQIDMQGLFSRRQIISVAMKGNANYGIWKWKSLFNESKSKANILFLSRPRLGCSTCQLWCLLSPMLEIKQRKGSTQKLFLLERGRSTVC
ncbi:hypothetical protein FPOAC2_05176 [Fusarium poae]